LVDTHESPHVMISNNNFIKYSRQKSDENIALEDFKDVVFKDDKGDVHFIIKKDAN